MTVRFRCDRLLTPDELIESATLVVADGRIVETVHTDGGPADVHLSGTVVPGLVDLQVNGFGDHGVLDSGPDEIAEIAMALLAQGVTSWLPTVVTAPEDVRLRTLDAIAAARGAPGARILGAHLEGPWISLDRLGAHDAASVALPNRGSIARCLERHDGLVRIVTIAPELEGALDAITQIVASGVVASIGHTNATYAEALAAIDAGARMATHVFNAMRPFAHRDPGVIGAVLDDHRVVAGAIADGRHLHPSALRLLFRSCTVALVSDAVGAVAGMEITGDAPTRFGGVLAGSFAGLGDGVGRAVDAGLSLHDVVAAATSVPAGVLGEPVGGLLPGRPADLAVLDDGLRPVATYLGGELVWSAGIDREDLYA